MCVCSSAGIERSAPTTVIMHRVSFQRYLTEGLANMRFYRVFNSVEGSSLTTV